MTIRTSAGRWPVLVMTLALGVVRVFAQECLDCHDTDLDPEAFAESIHGFMDCGDCHSGTDDYPHEETAVACGDCHDAGEALAESVHDGTHSSDAPTCESCHGPAHDIVARDDPRSAVHPSRLAATCGSCHADPEFLAKHDIPLAKPIEAYQASVHAQATADGTGSVSCSSCHGSHGIQAARDPRSTVFHANVPGTCGQCHTEIAEVYSRSVHGTAAAHGAREAPVCTDCHGEHRILSPSSPSSPVNVTNIPKLTCGRCHGDLRVSEKYDIDLSVVATYEDSYHGLAERAGQITVATCDSCHGVHDILPSSNPASHVHPDNLAQTCGRCHPGAGTRFAIGRVHVSPQRAEHGAVYWVRAIYLSLIYLVIGGMVLHNGLDLYRKARSPLPAPQVSEEQRDRMSKGFRTAHGLLILSFVTLAYTGFALKYPEHWWARPVLQWEDRLGLRGLLHRTAAVVMMVALGFHGVHLAMTRKARECIYGMRLGWRDWREFRERLGYFFGRRHHPPRTAKLGYTEKLEYLALMWGLLIMCLTGFALWFENLALRWLPKWATDVATVIHFYEAVLATLAILVWHFYFVIFDPLVYPMDTAWLTGKEPAGRAAEREPAEPRAAVVAAKRKAPDRARQRRPPRRS